MELTTEMDCLFRFNTETSAKKHWSLINNRNRNNKNNNYENSINIM